MNDKLSQHQAVLNHGASLFFPPLSLFLILILFFQPPAFAEIADGTTQEKDGEVMRNIVNKQRSFVPGISLVHFFTQSFIFSLNRSFPEFTSKRKLLSVISVFLSFACTFALGIGEYLISLILF